MINYGTAGKISEKLRALVEVAHVVQRDMMAMPLAPRGRTPFSPDLDRLASGYGDVTCGTGDSFVTSSDPWLNENNTKTTSTSSTWNCSRSPICQRHSVRWRAFKFITDDANDFAAEHWTANVADGQELFWDAVKKLTSSGLDLRS